MDNMSNLQIIEQLYKYVAEKNIPAALALCDKDIVWVRPGAPEIPFAGTFKGFEELGKMITILTTTIKVESFVPKKMCASDDLVVVLGVDTVLVLSTNKTYVEDWAQAFTLKDGKVTNVQVYMDTKAIADAFKN